MSKPREFWMNERTGAIFPNPLLEGISPKNKTLFREVTGDEIRVSREDWNLLVEHMDFEEFNSATSLIQRIERKSK